MTPADFPQANTQFGHPDGYTEEQVATIPAFIGEWASGNLDGAPVVIVAWKPSPEELKQLNEGSPVFLGVLGQGLPPHFLTTHFPA